MKARILLLLTIVALVSAGGMALWQARGSALAQSSGPPTLAGYTVGPSTASGGHYRLTSTQWQVEGSASGGAYHLTVPLSPAGTGTPCCCTLLPCLLRGF